MEITKKDVCHIADLARLKFSEEEIDGIQKDLTNILTYVEELKDVASEETEITVNPIYDENRFRDDVVVEDMKTQAFLQNAPDSLENYLRVPNVIEVENEVY